MNILQKIKKLLVAYHKKKQLKAYQRKFWNNYREIYNYFQN